MSTNVRVPIDDRASAGLVVPAGSHSGPRNPIFLGSVGYVFMLSGMCDK